MNTTANKRNAAYEHAVDAKDAAKDYMGDKAHDVEGSINDNTQRDNANARNGVDNERPLARDLLHPDPEKEREKSKLKRLVQEPNSYFMDVKCPGCYKITPIFSHAQTVVVCPGCNTVLCQPTGGKAQLTEGCSFRKKDR